MSQDWFTAKELAGLTGLPGTSQGVHIRAKSEAWEHRRRRGRGGGWEYAFRSLPSETQAAILAQTQPKAEPRQTRPAKANTGPVDRESLWEAYERKPDSIKDEAARRLAALNAVDQIAENGTGRSKAISQVANAYGESRATLYRWQKAVKGTDRSDWLALLAPRYGGRQSAAECDPAAWETFKSFYLRAEAPSIAACYEWTRQAAQEHGWKLASERTINRWVQEIPRSVRILAREGEHALMRAYPSQRRTVADLHSMYWINGDGYQHNVFVKMDPADPNEKPWRPKTWIWQDVRSRRILAWRPDVTENTDMIRLALGDVIEHYGIPEHATIDNTRAAANKWMTGGTTHRMRFRVREEDPLGLMPQLGIDVHWTSVHKGKGWGQAKPVERAFGVGGFGEYVDKHPRLAGCYTGPNVMAKPENYQDRAVSFAEFKEVLTQAINAWNQKEGRRTEVCAGQYSFDQAFHASYERNAHQIRRATQAQRRMWLLAAESVRVQRDASLKLSVGKGPEGQNRYGGDALLDYVGQKIVVRFDPDNLHSEIYAYESDGRYIGAVPCLVAIGFGDQASGRDWSKFHKQKRKATKQARDAEARMDALEAAQYLPADQPDPEPEANDAKVYRGAFGETKAVAGSDVTPEHSTNQGESDDGDRFGFNGLMEQFREKLKEDL